MIDRIKQLMEEKGLSSTQFADGVDVPRAVISHILSGRNKPSLDVVIKILSAHRDVSMSWLLLGDGQMHDKPAAPVAVKPESEINGIHRELPVNAPDEKEGKQENVQSEAGELLPQKNSGKPIKKIERIVYFYSDKTFETYKPG